jgi:trehalose 6-phosphate phosphatase
MLRQAPDETVLSCDFDGTLSPIVDDPAAARPLDGVADVLAALAQRYATVAVLSGRPVSFLDPLVPAAVQVHGLYGLEARVDGIRVDANGAGAWREAFDDVVVAARAWAPEGVLVEPKGVSLTLHYRTRPEAEAEVAAFAAAQAKRSGLALRPARMSVELHPPVNVDKGSVLLALASGAAAAAFIGDDAGDLPAFDALDRLGSEGVGVARVAVRSAESPPSLLGRADLVVEGPPGALSFLQSLL